MDDSARSAGQRKAEMRAAIRARHRDSAAPGPVTPDLLPWLRAWIPGISYDLPAVPPGEARPQPPVVTGFIRHGHEVDVEPLLQTLIAEGVTVALPRVESDGLVFITWNGRDLAEGAYGLLEPVSGDPVSQECITAMLIPALACDRAGARLGRGGGYYDRALAQMPHTALLIGVIDDSDLMPAGGIPTEQHDISMDAIATPLQVVDLRD